MTFSRCILGTFFDRILGSFGVPTPFPKMLENELKIDNLSGTFSRFVKLQFEHHMIYIRLFYIVLKGLAPDFFSSI